jgi:hypothetical protein
LAVLIFLDGIALFLAVVYFFVLACPGLKLRVFVGDPPWYLVQLLP